MVNPHSRCSHQLQRRQWGTSVTTVAHLVSRVLYWDAYGPELHRQDYYDRSVNAPGLTNTLALWKYAFE